MSSIIEWFKTGTHALASILALVVALDVVFAHVKNQYLNHAAGALALVAQRLMDLLQISKLPVVGPALSGLLDVLIGVPPGTNEVRKLAMKKATDDAAVAAKVVQGSQPSSSNESAETPNDRPPMPPKAA